MKTKLIILLVSMLLPVSAVFSQPKWDKNKVYRGFNISPFIKESDIEHLSKLNVELVRLSFEQESLIDKTPPYDYVPKAWQDLENIVNWCAKYSILLIIDPHTTPGTVLNATTTGRDPFLTDEHYHTYLMNMWIKLSNKFKHNSTVIGYDLLNEPTAGFNFPDSGPGSWYALSCQLVKAIRNNGDEHTIILEPAAGRLNTKWLDRTHCMPMLKLPKDDNLVVSPHFYYPEKFTGQTPENSGSYHYPGNIDGEYWDKARLDQEIQPIVEFQRKHNVPILMGEVGVSRFSGPDGNNYIRDIISLFEKYHFSWTYHAYRATNPLYKKLGRWEVEASVDNPDDNNRNENSSRMEILKPYFKNNR